MTTLRLQQLLATLDYLPLTFTPADPASVSPNEAATAQVGILRLAVDDDARATSWRLWSPGMPNTITQGAVMAFESQQHMATDGLAGPQGVAGPPAGGGGRLRSTATGTTTGWTCPTTLPEHVNVWRDGQIAYTTRANTGIAAAPDRARDLARVRPLHLDDHAGHQPRRQSTTRTRASPGSATSTAATPSTASSGPATATPRASGAWSCHPPHAAVVYPYTPLGTLVTVE